MELFTGTIILILAIIAIIAGYVQHLSELYRDIATEEAEIMADERFNDMIEHAEIRVVQKLYIIDEMESGESAC